MKGYITLTFDFRGAGLSKGRTSWTGRGEKEDYGTVVGVGICLVVELLKLFREGAAETLDTDAIGSGQENPYQLEVSTTGVSHAPSFESHTEDPKRSVTFILAGYSYGSLIASLLSPLSTICEQMAQPSAGSPAAEIRLRGRHLARELYHEAFLQPRQPCARKNVRSQRKRSQPSPRMIIGGEKSPNAHTNCETERGRSMDTIKKSVEKSASRFHLRSRSHQRNIHSHGPDDSVAEINAASIPPLAFPKISPHFLLLSPILPPLSSLLTGFTYHHFSSSAVQQQVNLRHHPTLAVFGIEDGFTSYKRLQKWARGFQESGTGGRFTVVGIEGAGHFWREEGVEGKLREVVREWVEGLVVSK